MMHSTDDNPFAAPKVELAQQKLDFAHVRERLLGFGGVWTTAFQVYRSRPGAFVVIAVVVGLPFNIVLQLIPSPSLLDMEETVAILGALGQSMRVATWLDSIWGVLGVAGMAYLTEAIIEDRTVSASDMVKMMVSRWPAMIGQRFVVNVVVQAATLCLIIPGIYLRVLWLFSDQIVALRKQGPVQCLGYSRDLVQGQWWTMAGYGLVLSGLTLIIYGIDTAIFWFIPEASDSERLYQVLSVVVTTVCDVLNSFVVVMGCVLFLNQDYRHFNREMLEPLQQ